MTGGNLGRAMERATASAVWQAVEGLADRLLPELALVG